MHKKEQVIAPIVESALGVQCVISAQFNTDLFGTFSGEIDRKSSPLETLREKCLAAMKEAEIDLGIANEGSFGPHPSLFFAPADDELMILIDLKNNIEIVARELSSDTNFNGSEIKNEHELFQFAQTVKFPSHSLIMKNSKEGWISIEKGINNTAKLSEIYKHFMYAFGSVYVETDMRAMHNPTRMEQIKKLSQKLVAKVNSCCSECQSPGFDVSKVQPGLPCELCNRATNSTLSLIYTCKKCNHSEEKMYPDAKLKENPMYCDYCNP